jgi:hypothetical protein
MAVLALAIITMIPALQLTPAHAEFDSPIIILRSSFVDSAGLVNVVGTVRNYAELPVQVTVGLRTLDGRTLQADTYGRTIWPLTDSPFKFTLGKGVEPDGEPFLYNANEVKVVHQNMLALTYDGMAVGDERAFVGKVKNTGQFEVHNVSVFAAVHSADHLRQLDTVRSEVIPVILPGQELDFVAVPDPMIRQDILYYSCAGIDYDDPITTVNLGGGKLLPYDLSAVAQVRDFRYDNSTDSLAFGITPYSQEGSGLKIEIPQQTGNQTVNVLVDGSIHDASVVTDGRTMSIDFFIPKGDHEVQIQGVRNVPEIPYAVIALAAIMAGAVASLRLSKAAFKIS